MHHFRKEVQNSILTINSFLYRLGKRIKDRWRCYTKIGMAERVSLNLIRVIPAEGNALPQGQPNYSSLS